MYIEKMRDSGSAFIAYLRHHYLKGDRSKINFLARSLKYVLTSLDFTERALLVLVHKPENPGIQQTVTRMVIDRDFSQLVNSCFQPIGILSTSPEIKMLLKFFSPVNLPCLAVLRLQPGPVRSVKLDHMDSLSNTTGEGVSVEQLHASLLAYVKLRNNNGSRLAVVERGAADIARISRLQGERE